MFLFILCSLGNRPYVICVTGKIADARGTLSGHWLPPYVLCIGVPLLHVNVHLFIYFSKELHSVLQGIFYVCNL